MTSGLRERKKVRTRRAIIDAAWDLFRRKGYEATTVDEIASAAEVSRRTFFRYFPTKESVVFHDSAERLARFRGLLADGEPGFDTVWEACLALARDYESRRATVMERYELIASSPTLTMRESEIDREWIAAIAEALVEPESDEARQRRARIQAGAIFGAMKATLAEWLESGGASSLDLLARDALEIFVDGFGVHRESEDVA